MLEHTVLVTDESNRLMLVLLTKRTKHRIGSVAELTETDNRSFEMSLVVKLLWLCAGASSKSLRKADKGPRA
jgi:hypothetical protein